MKLQYLSGHSSVTKGFLIPIGEWNGLKAKSRNADREEMPEIPDWHKKLLVERIEAYENGLEELFDTDEALNDIEKDLY